MDATNTFDDRHKYAPLRGVRAIRHLSQQEVAQRAGISRFRYQQAEAGYGDLTVAEFEAVARVLRLDDDDIWSKAFWQPDEVADASTDAVERCQG